MLIYLKEMQFGKCFISGRKRKDALLFCLYWRRIFFYRKRGFLSLRGRFARHPGLGMYDTRVSGRTTPGCQYARHPGVI